MKPYGFKGSGRGECKSYDCIDPYCKQHAGTGSRRKKKARQEAKKELRRVAPDDTGGNVADTQIGLLST